MNEADERSGPGLAQDAPRSAKRSWTWPFTDRSGMTLMELGVVLVTIAIVASMMSPMVDVFRPGLRSATLELTTSLSAAQRSAVLHQHNVIVMFDTVQVGLRVHKDLDNDGVVDSGEPLTWVMIEETVQFGRGAAPAVDARTQALTFAGSQNGYPALTFHRNGSASEEGIAYVTSRRPGGSVDDARAVRIERATGQMTCLRFRASTWKEDC